LSRADIYVWSKGERYVWDGGSREGVDTLHCVRPYDIALRASCDPNFQDSPDAGTARLRSQLWATGPAADREGVWCTWELTTGEWFDYGIHLDCIRGENPDGGL
jgi:hypothetical protein